MEFWKHTLTSHRIFNIYSWFNLAFLHIKLISSYLFNLVLIKVQSYFFLNRIKTSRFWFLIGTVRGIVRKTSLSFFSSNIFDVNYTFLSFSNSWSSKSVKLIYWIGVTCSKFRTGRLKRNSLLLVNNLIGDFECRESKSKVRANVTALTYNTVILDLPEEKWIYSFRVLEWLKT